MAQKKQSRKKAAKPAARKKAPAQPAARKAASKRPAGTSAGRPAGRRADADPVAQIQRVIDVMVAAGAVEVELEEAGLKLRVRLKSDIPVSVMPYAAPPAAPLVAAPSGPHGAEAVGSPAAAPPADDPKRTVFKSPMVGTFYRSSAPDADPFVEVGDRVGPDTTLCILEAMKVMNEIKAETSGEIVEILAQNGEPVEFGQPLFVIKVD